MSAPLTLVNMPKLTSLPMSLSLTSATLTCGLVRFRIYSFWSLTVVDIAKTHPEAWNSAEGSAI